jgi:hypothetical protein
MAASNEESKALVRRLADAVNSRHFDLLHELIAPNFVRHCQATPEVDLRGLEQFKDFLKQDVVVFPARLMAVVRPQYEQSVRSERTVVE